MKAAEFDYLKAKSLDEVCAALARGDREARIIAGGQTLAPLMAMRLARPELLVDINGIAELQGIALEGDEVVIKAATRQRTAERSALVAERLPLLAQALPWVGHLQTRNRGTVGGSLANADPSAEIPLVAVALEAKVVLRSAAGRRQLPVAEFLLAPMETAIRADELLSELRFPLRDEGHVGIGFEEVGVRAGDFAILAVAAEVVLDADGVCRRARFAVGGAAPVPFRAQAVEAALVGGSLDDVAVGEAVVLVDALLQPSSDPHASAAYRRRLAPALLARAILAARDDARATTL